MMLPIHVDSDPPVMICSPFVMIVSYWFAVGCVLESKTFTLFHVVGDPSATTILYGANIGGRTMSSALDMPAVVPGKM